MSDFEIDAEHFETFFDGQVRLYLGDSYRIENLEGFRKTGGSICIDPPYIIATSGGGAYRKARPPVMDKLAAAGLDKGFDLSILNWQFADSIACFCSNDQLQSVMARLQQGFHRVCVRVWCKTNPQPVANKHYRPDTEFIVHAWQKGAHPLGDLSDKHRWIMGACGKNDFDHPSVKPDYVMDRVVTNFRGPILDLFMGTGSTGIAAVKQGKGFIGIEHNPDYFKIACGRFAALEAAYRSGEMRKTQACAAASPDTPTSIALQSPKSQTAQRIG